ncbi:serine hydrolase [uncultured Sphingomonas sp.]|uniref:serine hydrolase domain-containing protein n=1 Tax=uncultured Sphingomonas sp. TaxID=158754 RepID=UPI0025D66B38|nr:serine hydrolase domain-containing protein [uncultured Sphingomonas sp.]
MRGLIRVAALVSALSTVTIAPVPTSAIAAEQAPNFDAAFAEVQSWVGKAFPGAVVAVGVHGRLVALKAFGRISSAPDAPPMPRDAIFDLASLTKVVGTTTAAEILYDRGLLDLDRPVVAYLPSFAGTPGHERITVRHLLSHSSGLFTTDLLWQHSRNRQELLALIDRMPMAWAPGTHYQYRDENMILMGEIIERLSGQPLDRFLHDAVFAPLGMTDTGFNPPASRIDRIPPTEQDDLFRHRLVRGEVHDENAFVLGGVAGHAGLFSTARDLSRLAQVYLDHGRHNGRPFLKPGSLAAFTTRTAFPPGSLRALGWDMPDPAGSFAGPLASPDALIHTGFTGTSIYIDRSRDAFVILLTNRVNPTRTNKQIAEARIAIHTAILSAIDASARPSAAGQMRSR